MIHEFMVRLESDRVDTNKMYNKLTEIEGIKILSVKLIESAD